MKPTRKFHGAPIIFETLQLYFPTDIKFKKYLFVEWYKIGNAKKLEEIPYFWKHKYPGDMGHFLNFNANYKGNVFKEFAELNAKLDENTNTIQFNNQIYKPVNCFLKVAYVDMLSLDDGKYFVGMNVYIKYGKNLYLQGDGCNDIFNKTPYKSYLVRQYALGCISKDMQGILQKYPYITKD